MHDKSVFLNFIGYCIETFSAVELSRSEWKKFLKSADLQDPKAAAMTLYFIRVAINRNCINAAPLLQLPYTDLCDYIVASEKHCDSYKLTLKPFTFYTVDKMVIKDIKSMQGDANLIDKILKSTEKASKASKTSKTSKTTKTAKTTKTTPVFLAHGFLGK